jgi:hypothetical protein
MARVSREVLDRQVGPAQGVVHQQLRGRHGTLGTRMDLAMVKQEQGETLRKYMRHF